MLTHLPGVRRRAREVRCGDEIFARICNLKTGERGEAGRGETGYSVLPEISHHTFHIPDGRETLGSL